MTIRIVIAESLPVVRRGLAVFLKTQEDFEIVGEAANGEEAAKLAEELKPDIVLMNPDMPIMDGIVATSKIKDLDSSSRVMVLTNFSNQNYVYQVIKAGASDCQLMNIKPGELAASIRRLVASEILPPAKPAPYLQSGSKSVKQVDGLTKREREVIREIASGKSNKEISSVLFITVKTVKTHVSNILAKLGLDDRTQAALYAVENNLEK
ncbi:LuxR C-terminal-related transcriptional regulator [Bacillus sp. EB01]|uniref:LuxR C-terminal-related transcriptional regulator n=1 Tax=Bacillus sp. EB01 TaxID=1347086 RepID=UPI0005C77C8A|nr:response regulator transcription factor [Bacillus sp. EB01]